MIDTQRLQSAPRCVAGIAEVAALCARERGGATNALEVATYFPLDVPTVARVLDSLHERVGVHGEERGGVAWTRFDRPDDFNLRMLDLERGEHLDANPALMRHIARIKDDAAWLRNVRDQHLLLHLASVASERMLEPAYFAARADLTNARVQSVLNDLSAGGHIDLVLDEDTGALRYRFPALDYPEARFRQNLAALDGVAPPEGRPVFLAAVALALAFILFLVLSVRLHIF